MSIESMRPSNHLILCCPLLLLPLIFPSIGVFSSELALHVRWPKNWSFSSSISPSNEYSGLISFRMDWFDLLAVQGTLKTLLQHHSSKASILWHSAFFMIYDYMAMPVVIFDCQGWGWERVLTAWWVETWDAANHSTLHRTACHNKSFSCSSFP